MLIAMLPESPVSYEGLRGCQLLIAMENLRGISGNPPERKTFLKHIEMYNWKHNCY